MRRSVAIAATIRNGSCQRRIQFLRRLDEKPQVRNDFLQRRIQTGEFFGGGGVKLQFPPSFGENVNTCKGKVENPFMIEFTDFCTFRQKKFTDFCTITTFVGVNQYTKKFNIQTQTICRNAPLKRGAKRKHLAKYI